MATRDTPPPQKRWFSDGPTMAYSRLNRSLFWLFNLLMYVLLNMFYLRMQTGVWVQMDNPYRAKTLIEQVLSPLSIFQFPSQIVVIGLLAALTCAVPIVIAQLYNLLQAVPFVLVVLFFGHNPMLSLCLFVSCAMVSFEPMRFKSKFVSAVLCLIPEILYWAFYSGDNPLTDPLQWAVLYAPWALAFLLCVVLFGVVLLIGHVFRYRPGILMPIFGLLLAGAVVLFHYTVGMNERDFQADVYRNSPGQLSEFKDENIVPLLEEELSQRRKQLPYLTDEAILGQLRFEWRSATTIFLREAPQTNSTAGIEISSTGPTSFARRKINAIALAQFRANDQINHFIDTHKDHRRVADALYYKALLFDVNINLRALRDEDMLRFYYDVPSVYSRELWEKIVSGFGHSPVSIEARYRLARLLAAQQPLSPADTYHFEEAYSLLEAADQLCTQELHRRAELPEKTGWWNRLFGSVFARPAPTINTEQLLALQNRVRSLVTLIGKENRTGHSQHDRRLAIFVELDQNQLLYPERLKELKFDSPQPDPLLDNIELAQALLEKDLDGRITLLTELAQTYADRDGGIEAMLHLALALLSQRDRSEFHGDQQVLRSESTKYLQNIMALRPDSYPAQYAREILANTPLE